MTLSTTPAPDFFRRGTLLLWYIACLLALLGFVSGCGSAKPAAGVRPSSVEVAFVTDTLDTIRAAVESGEATLLDVRSEAEWNESHLVAAKLIPVTTLSDPSKLSESIAGLDRDKPIYIHCQRGGRALTAAKILVAEGFDARPIEENYESFGESGFETIPAAE